MQLKYYSITTTCHTVEVPERCPGCGTNLHNGKLVCEQWEYTEQVATLRAGEFIDWSASSAGHEDITNGWRCLDCNHVLARG